MYEDVKFFGLVAMGGICSIFRVGLNRKSLHSWSPCRDKWWTIYARIHQWFVRFHSGMKASIELGDREVGTTLLVKKKLISCWNSLVSGTTRMQVCMTTIFLYRPASMPYISFISKCFRSFARVMTTHKPQQFVNQRKLFKWDYLLISPRAGSVVRWRVVAVQLCIVAGVVKCNIEMQYWSAILKCNIEVLL